MVLSDTSPVSVFVSSIVQKGDIVNVTNLCRLRLHMRHLYSCDYSMARNIAIACAPVVYYGKRVCETVTEFFEAVIDRMSCIIDLR